MKYPNPDSGRRRLNSLEKLKQSVIITDHGKQALEVRRFRDRKPLETLKGSVIRYEEATRPVADDE